MIEPITIVETTKQTRQLFAAGVDTLYFGEEQFGLRLPTLFTREGQRQLVELVHKHGKKTNIAANGIIHPEKMKNVPEYLAFLKEVNIDMITVGDTDIIYTMKKSPELRIPYIYDAETLVTSARQINLWTERGAVGTVLACEIPFEEMKAMKEKLDIPVEIPVYGVTYIHQSKRPLLQNYYSYVKQDEQKDHEGGLSISEPKKEETYYSIYKDSHGAHISASNDLNLLSELNELYQHHYRTWKPDGLFIPGGNFVTITQLFAGTKKQILEGSWNQEKAEKLTSEINKLHPENRELDTGSFYIDPPAIK